MEKIIKALKLAKNKKALVFCFNNDKKYQKLFLVAKRINLKTYYFASKYSDTITEQLKNKKANLFFYGGLFCKGLMLEGSMEILNDMETKNLIWNKNLEKRFKNGGINDPDFCVLKFTANYGNLYCMNKVEIIEFR